MANLINCPEVSVILATYNEPKNIIQQSIDSILSQSFVNLELLIIDDSTSIETKTYIDSLASDARVVIIRRFDRIGFVEALNIGLKQAKGAFIARMDADDIALPKRLEIQLNYLKENPAISVVGGSIYCMDENGLIQSERRYPTSGLRLNFYSIYKNPLAHPTVMMRRKCVDSGFLYDIKYKKSEDLEYWLRLKNNGFFYANVQDFVLKYRTGSDLHLKRKKDNWKFNFKARLSNFSFRSPITCLLGITISYIYTILPSFFIRTIYKYQSSK